ncbi:MAG: sulfatase [Myxococcota bacterium]|nr:sulfatase [Myxococcota bacterium]
MVSRERLFLEKARTRGRVAAFLAILFGGLACGPSSPPPSWSVENRLVDLLAGETQGMGLDLPIATIRDDTRYVLRRPRSQTILLWNFIDGHKKAGVIQRTLDVPPAFSSESALVIFPSIMMKGGEWIGSEATLAPVVGRGPGTVEVEFDAPENPGGRRIELHAEAFAASNSELRKIEIPAVAIEPNSELRFSIGMVKPELQTSGEIFSVHACVDSGCERIFEEVFDPPGPDVSGWRDRRISLDDWSGQEVAFRFESEASGDPTSGFPAWPVWANPTVYQKGQRDPAGKNVILLSIDTLRADHLSSYGYLHPTSPFIDERFARQGTVFDHPVAAAATTSPAHASIFTAVDVATHRTYDGFHTLPPEIPTLSELVRAGGIDTASYNENGWLSARIGFSRGFDRFVENRSHQINSPSGQVDRTFDAAAQWLRENRDTPFFLFLHTYQVHTPYAPPEKYKNLFVPTVEGGGEIPAELAAMADYDREIRYTDDELRRFFETVDELDLGRDTVVILTSDHGEAFFEHGAMEHGTRLDEPVLRVPLMFWGADVPQGQRLHPPVSQIDFLPTVLAILGLPLPADIQGSSLLPVLANGEGAEFFETRPVFSQVRAPYALLPDGTTRKAMTPGIGVRLGNMKLARYTAGEGEYVYEYYDVVADPAEENDLSASRPEEVEVLRAMLDRHEEDRARFLEEIQGGKPAENKAGPLSPDQESKLRALGYIE